VITKEVRIMDKNKIDNLIKKSYLSSFATNSEEISYLILIMTKVIGSDRSKKKSYLDIDRLYDEFVYFKYYSEMTDTYLLPFTLPLVFVNRSYESYREDMIDLISKLTRFYKVENEKYEYILDNYIYDVVYRYMLIKDFSEPVALLEKIKGKLVEYNPFEDNKNENIKLQVKKIAYIDDLHKLVKYFELNETCDIRLNSRMLEIIRRIYTKELVGMDECCDMGMSSIENSLVCLVGDVNKQPVKMKVQEEKITFEEEFLLSMAEYLIKLRNNGIQTLKYIDRYKVKSSPRKLLTYEEGQEFFDPILNKSIVKKKTYENQSCSMTISTKTGDYKFTFRGRE